MRRWALLFAASLSLLMLSGCQDAEPEARARRVVTRADLIGGPSALGEVGDYLLENDKIRVIIQDKGFSRGFGVYGGGLIDADLVRSVAPGGAAGGNGRDQFGELFPIALLQALEPSHVEVVSDGSDGGAAVLRVSGAGGDFFSLTKTLNQAVLNSHVLPPGLLDLLDVNALNGTPQLAYQMTYTLEPGARHVKITYRISNISEERVEIPPDVVGSLLSVAGFELDLDTFRSPLGMVMLFGAGNKVFNPGSGYNLRFDLEDAYAKGGAAGLQFPVLPGLLTPGLISTSKSGISYGLFAEPDPRSPTFVADRFNFGPECSDEGMTSCSEVMAGLCDDALATCRECTSDTVGDDGCPGEACSDIEVCCGLAHEDCTSKAAVSECLDGRCAYNAYAHAYDRDVADDTMLVPFVASAFTGVFHGQTPAAFEPIPAEHRCTSHDSCSSGVCCMPQISEAGAVRAACSEDEDCSGGRRCEASFCVEPVLGWCAPAEAPTCVELPDSFVRSKAECESQLTACGACTLETLGQDGCPEEECSDIQTCCESAFDDCNSRSVIEFSTFFVVGDGDAGSVMDAVYGIKETPTEIFAGQVIDGQGGYAVEGASVLIYAGHSDEGAEGPINQLYTDKTGRFKCRLPEGAYRAQVHRAPLLSPPVPFSISPGMGKFLNLAAPVAATISVQVSDPSGRRLPAKVTVVGRTDGPVFNTYRYLYETGLFNPSAGQEWRVHDLVPDDASDGESLRYIESAHYTENGSAVFDVPPGLAFDIYVSRGTEYSLDVHEDVRAQSGQTVHLSSRLRRVVPTPGYVSADFHLHAKPSLDSALPLDERVRSIVGEGVEVLVATDHNFVTDYAPTIEELGLQNWATSMVGIEMTTLESGHFNGFPLERDVGAITKGAFEWSQRPPGDIFDAMRNMGALGSENTIIQVNHPRDSILGYFSQYGLDSLSGMTPPPVDCSVPDLSLAGDCLLSPNGPAFRNPDGTTTFSNDFDAIEIINGSVSGQLHHQRIPEGGIDGLTGLPAELIAANPPAGAILCNDDGEVAFPGTVDDWFNLLNRGRRVMGTGTSDSHDAHDHPGAGRTYVYVGHDDPGAVTTAEIVAGVKSGRLVATSGPFVEFFVNEQPMGSEVSLTDNLTVQLRFNATTPDWMHVDQAIIWGNGKAVLTLDAPSEQPCEELVDARCWTWSGETTLTEDTWLVLEVTGRKSMFPVQRPIDLSPILIQDAISSFAEPLGLIEADYGELNVERFGQVLPAAITNPIWVDADGEDGFQPPWVFDEAGVATPATREQIPRCVFNDDGESQYHALAPEGGEDLGTAQQPLKTKPRFQPSFGHPRLKHNMFDVRVLFEQFGAHGH